MARKRKVEAHPARLRSALGGGRTLLLVAVLSATASGCPLPFEFNGKGSGNSHSSDPSSPDLTAPVVVSYSEQGGTSGTISNGGSFVAGQTTTVTLSTTSLNAVIFYTDDGTALTDLRTAKKIDASRGSFTITRTTIPQSLDIHAVGVGSNLLPSPAIHATVGVSPAFTVTYNGNGNTGGTAPTDTNSYLFGATVVMAGPGTMTKSGFNFGGWNTAADGSGTGHGAGTSMTMGSANVTLYAVWTLIPTYFVTYNGNGSNGGLPPSDGTGYPAGGTVTVLSPGTLSKSSNVFVGWNTAADGSGTTYSGGNTFTMGTGNVILYAIWLPVTGTTITSVPTTVTNVVIPAGITGFTTVFQSHANLISVTLPSTISAIQVQAFLGCTSLTTIVSSNARYQVINGALVDTVTGVLMLVPAKLSRAFSIPSVVTSIDPYAFDSCATLTSISIPPSLTAISGNGFSGLRSLITIVLPSTVTTIGSYGFYNSSVEAIAIPSTVTSIGASAMGACPDLGNVYMQSGTPPTLGTTAFTAPVPAIHVPSPLAVAAYKAAPNWSTFAASIMFP